MKHPAADKIKVPDAFWEGIKRAGLTRADVIREAKIPIGLVREKAPLSTAQFFALWQVLINVSHDAAIGLRIATGLDSAVMPPSFMAAYHARDLRDALERVARFKRLCAPEQVLIKEKEDRCEISIAWTHADSAAPPALVDATFASLMELGRKGTGKALTAAAVELARAPLKRAAYDEYFGCKVRFNAQRDAMVFKRADLDERFGSYNSDLLDILVPELDRQLEQQAHSATLAEQIRWVLKRRLAAGRPTLGVIATELAISERSLQRRLTEEGLTFQGLLGQTRHQLALEYLADASLSLIEVAFMLGYEDQNSFFRSFRQWESRTPSEWRSELNGSGH